MSPKFLFSIVIPTYNQCKYLEKAINSVLDQKENYEIIIIDNYSTDGTERLVKSFNIKNIKYFKIKNEGVIGTSRNLGINNANGSWIAFLDSDDLWFKDKLETIEKFIKADSSFDVITNDEEIIYEGSKNKTIWKYGPFTNNFYKKLLLDGNCISTSASVVKKSFLDQHDILFSEKKTFASVEDYDFFLNLALNDAKFKFINSPLGRHLYHEKSFSRNLERHHNALKEVLFHHLENKQRFTKNLESLKKRINANISISYALAEIQFNKNIIKAFKILIKSFAVNHFYLIERIIKKLYIKLRF